MKKVESKAYSWKWVTSDELLSKVPCELIFTHHVPSTAGTSTVNFYNGEDNSGDLIIQCRTAESRATVFAPPKPVYCRRGLYVDIKANCLGVFVMWRELGRGEGD